MLLNSNQKREGVAIQILKQSLSQKLLQETNKDIINDKRVNSPRRYEKCISAPNFRAPKLIRQMLEELNGEIHNIMNNE